MKIIVDGNNVMCAAFYVTQSILDSKERVKKTVGLFSMMMGRLRKEFNVKKLYIAWDGKEGTAWRKAILPEYKANRPERNKILHRCIKKASNDFSDGNIHVQFLDAEGDDVIYALCRCLNNHKIIVSSDKDFIQVVQEELAEAVYNPVMKDYREIPEVDSVIEKSICGDQSDNLKGIPGKGPKSIKNIIDTNFNTLSADEKKIFDKHRLVIGLKNNPHKNELLEKIDQYLYAMTTGF